MNILILSRSVLAGAPTNLNNLINKYGNGEITSRCITSKNASHIKWKQDICWPWVIQNGKKEILEDLPKLKELVDWCDIIHIHNQPPFSNGNKSWEFISSVKKPFIVQVFSEPTKCSKMLSDMQKFFKIEKLVCPAQYHTLLYKEEHETARLVTDITNSLLMPMYIENSPPYITYSISNRATLEELQRKRGAEWAYKSFYEVNPILQKLNKENIISYKIFYDVDFEKSLKLRQTGNMHIDDIYTGAFHTSSLEGLSQGKLVFCNLKDWMIKLFETHMKAKWHPWEIADKNSLENKIRYFSKNRQEMLERQKKSREWMEKFYSPQIILEDY